MFQVSAEIQIIPSKRFIELKYIPAYSKEEAVKVRSMEGLNYRVFLFCFLSITANFIFEIHSLALDGFDLNSVQKLRSEKKNLDRGRI